MVQSLLRQAGFFFRVHESFGEPPDVIFIRVGDLPTIKELLTDYRVRDSCDG